MSARLAENRYGKHRVRVSKVRRPRQAESNVERHEFVEVSVDIELAGQFDDAFTSGDNRRVIATDTCKNTVYSLAQVDDIVSVESFGRTITRHFLDRYEHVQSCQVSLAETVWDRIGDSRYGFVARDRSQPTAVVHTTRGGAMTIRSGVKGLLIAKTTESGFEHFHQDEYRTLPDVDDRILATELTAEWLYRGEKEYVAENFCDHRVTIVDALFTAFLDHYSHSVQETLFRMGQSALDACNEITQISLTMPNKHHLLAKLVPAGTTNENEVFVVTDEPFGFIQGTVTR